MKAASRSSRPGLAQNGCRVEADSVQCTVCIR